MSIFERLYSLEGKTALVTGGATGIGTMIATALVEAGANVMIASRKAEDCMKVADQLNQHAKAVGAKGSATGFGGNVSNRRKVLRHSPMKSKAARTTSISCSTMREHHGVPHGGISLQRLEAGS